MSEVGQCGPVIVAIVPDRSGGERRRPLTSPENLIDLIPHLFAARRLEIAHGAFHVAVTKPLLANRSRLKGLAVVDRLRAVSIFGADLRAMIAQWTLLWDGG
jgi:hypothetical protein